MSITPSRIGTVVFLVLLLSGTSVLVNAQTSTPLSENIAEYGLEMVVCTYFGGSELEWAGKSDFDSEGNLVLTGHTMSTDLPTQNANQSTYAGLGDAFVLKMSTDGEIVFATYFGGSGLEEAMTLMVDEENNIIIAGGTTSTDLPLQNPIQSERNGTDDGFIAKYGPTGNLVFSSYFGGSDEDRIERSGIDQYGNYVFTGRTGSDDFPITQGVYQENYGGGDTDLILTALSDDCQTIEYSTYFGNAADELGLDVDTDNLGNLVVVGLAYLETNTTEGVYQRDYGGGQSDSVIAKFSPNCTDLIWSTLLGGNGWEFGDDVDFDSSNNVVVSGYTGSTDFPLVDQFYNNSPNNDAFFAKLDPNGETLVFSTLLGGNLEDRSYGMEVLSDDAIVITSPASSTDMPTLNAIQANNSGGSDGYVAFFTEDEMVYASYLGGAGNDYVMGMSVYDEELVAIVGYTHSENLVMRNSIQTEYAGDGDIVIWVLSPQIPSGSPIIPILVFGTIGVVALLSVIVVYKRR
ncbi:MAG: hypothetical protein RTV31_14330 [Candidatus Thorarchaeota archaeon]